MNAEIRPFRKDIQKLAIFDDDTQDSDDDSYYRKKSIRVRTIKKSIIRSSETNDAPKVQDLISNSNGLDTNEMISPSPEIDEEF